MKDSIANASPSSTVAVYKALQVAVYTVDKTEINLTRQDLVELINVGSLSFRAHFDCVTTGTFCNYWDSCNRAAVGDK